MGEAASFWDETFEVILANINRNVILQTIEACKKALAPNGQILISGILDQDGQLIIQAAEKTGLKFQEQLKRNDWVCLRFQA